MVSGGPLSPQRRRIDRVLLAAAAAALLAPALRAAGVAGASFLSLPAGGRPAAMGGAYSALAQDAYAPVWNPAGLGALPNTQIAVMHLDYVESIGYEFASAAHPLGARDGIGAAVVYLHPKSGVGRDAAGAETGGFNAHGAAYTAAYGHAFGDSFSLGAAFKAVETRIADVSARSYGGDAGGLYRAGPRLSVAAVAANLGARLRFLNEADRLPETYRLGVLVSPLEGWSAAAEGVYERDEGAYARAGAEWRPLPPVALRAGWHGDGTNGLPGITGITAGLGLTAFGQRFEYAWVPMGDLGHTQYFSIVFSFGTEAAR